MLPDCCDPAARSGFRCASVWKDGNEAIERLRRVPRAETHPRGFSWPSGTSAASIVARRVGTSRRRTVIAPYPRDLVEKKTLRAASALHLASRDRPARVEPQRCLGRALKHFEHRCTLHYAISHAAAARARASELHAHRKSLRAVWRACSKPTMPAAARIECAYAQGSLLEATRRQAWRPAGTVSRGRPLTTVSRR